MLKRITGCIIGGLLLICNCAPKQNQDNSQEAPDIDSIVSRAEISYAFGVSIGSYFKDKTITVDYNSFLTGMKDMLEKNAPAISLEEVNQKINTYITMMSEKKARDDLEKEKAFFEKNKSEPGVITTASGLQYKILKEGSGKKPRVYDLVNIYYAGTLLSGMEFDTNLQQTEPAVYGLYSVVPGWREGLQLMAEGSKFKFYIPSGLGYGPGGYPPAVPPNATLIYEIELVSIIERTQNKQQE